MSAATPIGSVAPPAAPPAVTTSPAPTAPAPAPTPLNNLGEALWRARNRLGLSQQELAEQMGRPKSHVTDLERGRYRPDEAGLAELATQFRTDVHELIAAALLDRGFPLAASAIRSMCHNCCACGCSEFQG